MIPLQPWLRYWMCSRYSIRFPIIGEDLSLKKFSKFLSLTIDYIYKVLRLIYLQSFWA